MNKKMWKKMKKINQLKNKRMEQIKNEEVEKEIKIQEKNEKVISSFKTLKFKPRFSKITGYKLPEESTIHCSNGESLIGHTGDYYVCIDAIQEIMIPESIFKKLFIFDHKNND